MTWVGFGRAATVPVRRVQTPAGEGQIRATMDIMARVAASSASDVRVVEAAHDVIRGVASGHDNGSMARAIREWVTLHVWFVPDPLIDGDWVRTPLYLLDEIRLHGRAQADCDDVATLTAALGMAVGLYARFRAVAFGEHDTYSHVWTELRTEREWLVVDPTRGRVLPLIDRSLLLEIAP